MSDTTTYGNCAKCGIPFGSQDGSGLCARCRPLSDTSGPDWLPETLTLKLTVMDVGFLWGMLHRQIYDGRTSMVPAGVLRLMRKLDDLSNEVYDGPEHPESIVRPRNVP
jgi:hypothetical protein